jgi:hypothetical protein
VISLAGNFGRWFSRQLMTDNDYLGAEPAIYQLRTYNFWSNVEFILECPLLRLSKKHNWLQLNLNYLVYSK